MGSKLDADDKKTVLDAVKEAQSWFDANGSTASKEDFEEKKSELEGVVTPIVSKLYGSGGAGGAEEGGEADDHDEL